jgi:SAM-dependent methyltransferase
MRQTQKSPEQFCPVCDCSKCTKINVHFYNLHKCPQCLHVFSSFPEKSCEGHRVKYLNAIRQREKHFLQNVLTSKYKNSRSGVEDRKSAISRPYLNKEVSLLDTNIEDGTFLRSIQEKIKSSSGLCRDQSFKSYWLDVFYLGKSLEEVSTDKKFDVILLVDSFEFCYSLYETMIDCYRLLNPGGYILIDVPINNNPVKNYRARYHEFSTKSSLMFSEKMNNSKITYHHTVDESFASIIIQSSVRKHNLPE